MSADYGPRWRWRLARLLDHLPFMCWADLVCCALRWDGYRWREARIDWMCRNDLERNGVCYCGKIRSAVPGVTEAHPMSAEKTFLVRRLTAREKLLGLAIREHLERYEQPPEWLRDEYREVSAQLHLARSGVTEPTTKETLIQEGNSGPC